MRTVLLAVALVIGALTLSAVVRVVLGPTTYDRLLASSYAAVNSVVLVLLVGFLFGRPALFVDIGVAYALLAFLYPLAFAKFLERRRRA